MASSRSSSRPGLVKPAGDHDCRHLHCDLDAERPWDYLRKFAATSSRTRSPRMAQQHDVPVTPKVTGPILQMAKVCAPFLPIIIGAALKLALFDTLPAPGPEQSGF